MFSPYSRTAIPLACACVLLVGCGGSGDDEGGASSGGRALEWPAYNQEFAANQAELRLPTGVSWPREAPGSRTAPDGVRLTYEKGKGKADAERFWFCSWSREVVKDGAGGKRATRALRVLTGLKDTSLYQVSTAPQDRKIYDDELKRAGLGDTSKLARDVELNCPKS